MDTLEQTLNNLVEMLTERNNNYNKDKIKIESEYSNEINKYISSITELNVYKKLHLREEKIERFCLITEIDYAYVDPKSHLTNREKMLLGESPIDPQTKCEIHLHHIGQKFESPFAEIPKTIHQDDYSILHTNAKPSWRKDDEKKAAFKKQKTNHWRIRGKQKDDKKK